MAIKKQSSGRNYVYLELQPNCKKHLTEEQLAKRGGQGEPGFRYKEGDQVLLTRALTGQIASVRLGEDSYEGVSYSTASFKLVDDDTTDEIVRVRLDNSIGRRMVGLAVAAVQAGDPEVELWVSQVRAGSKFKDGTVATKDEVYLNAKDLSAEQRLSPVFLDEQGDPLSFTGSDGKEREMPMGKKLKFNGKEVWDFSEHIEIAKTTVQHLAAYFQHKETAQHTRGHAQGQTEAEADQDHIDVAEALAAAAPTA